MNNKTSLAYLILIIAPLFYACRGPEVKENDAPVSFVSVRHVVNEKYLIDKKESVVVWKGSNLLAPEQAHTGYAYISKGELLIEKSQLMGGTFEVDMNTIADKDHGSENDLVQHLKSPDFFDVKKFPISTFVITKVAPTNNENVNVTGNLTIKGITHAVTFAAKIEVKSGIVSANGKVVIDRTKWDVRYNSGKFYDNLADKAISDDIEFDMKIVAEKGARLADQTSESPTSSPAKILDSVKTNPTTKNVEPRAINSIFQSKDDGLTWQDISQGLPGNGQSEGFFAEESEIYVRIENEMYRSKNNLNTPVWVMENNLDPESASIDLNHSGVVEADGVLLRTGQTGIMRSTDHGEHWEWVISEGGVGIAIERIEGGFAAITYNTTTQSRRIRISLDRGKTWKAIDEGLQPSSSISSIKQMGRYLICGHPDGIFRSADLGKTWNMVLPSVDKPEFRLVPTFRSDVNDRRKVFKIYVSGKTLYAVMSASGC
jgi:polyisoprenoid-binding protein YceI/photosystem II stability/assembly factor-like uncharacterized protein